jgi:trafficking protein particle complex subunit 8
MLLTSSPAIPLHVNNALASIHPPSPELPAHAQLRALIYAVRWEISIASSEFLSSVLEGEHWLVWAAANVRLVSLSLVLLDS